MMVESLILVGIKMKLANIKDPKCVQLHGFRTNHNFNYLKKS